MINVMQNTQLYQKMDAEQAQYKAYLLTLLPAQDLYYIKDVVRADSIVVQGTER